MSEKRVITDELIAGERIRAILARASDLDATGLTGIRRHELQRIAEEAGISAAAFEQAMMEETTPLAPLPEPMHEKPWWKMDLVDDLARPMGRRFATTLSFVGIGAVFGYWGTVDARQGETLTFSVAVLIATAGYRVFKHRKDHDPAAYRSEVLSMFAALFLSYFMFVPRVPDGEIAPSLAVITALVAMLGTVAIQFRNDDHMSAVGARPSGNR